MSQIIVTILNVKSEVTALELATEAHDARYYKNI